jgi:hypothetical protein
LDLKTVKNDQIHIQTVKFEFKWTNQKVTSHYYPSAPAVDGSAGCTIRLGSNADTIDRSGQTIALPPAHRATSARVGGIASEDATVCHWNQPKNKTKTCMLKGQ